MSAFCVYSGILLTSDVFIAVAVAVPVIGVWGVRGYSGSFFSTFSAFGTCFVYIYSGLADSIFCSDASLMIFESIASSLLTCYLSDTDGCSARLSSSINWICTYSGASI